MPKPSKRSALLDVARELIQTEGYRGFSYRDLADRVGIKTASIHYHFPTKADLGRALMAEYRRDFGQALAALDPKASAASHLVGFIGLFRATLEEDGRMCMCGMLTSESASLPDEVRVEMRGFFDDCERWLTDTLTRGRRDGTLQVDGDPRDAARALFASLEGAMMAAYGLREPERFAAAERWLLGHLLS